VRRAAAIATAKPFNRPRAKEVEMRNVDHGYAMTVKGWWKRIRQSGQIERPRELSDARSWAVEAINGLHAEQERVRQQFVELEAAWFTRRSDDGSRTPREYHYHSLAERHCSVAGWCVTALEAVIAAGLSILLLALPWAVAAAVGIVVTVLLAVGLKGVIAPLVVGLYADRPKAGRDLALRLLIIAGPVVLALMALLFVVRGVGAWWAAAAFPLATAGLSVFCPVVAAALFVLAGLFGWSRRLTDQFRALEESERRVTELRDHCDRGLPVAVAVPARSGRVIPEGLAKIGAIVLCLAACLTGAACDANPEAATKNQGAAAVVTRTGGVAPAGADLWLDETVSVDQLDLVDAEDAIVNVLAQLSARLEVQQWRVFGFGDDAWRERPFHVTTLPRRDAPTCDPPTEASRIFKVQQDNAECRERARAADQLYEEQMAKAIADLRRAIIEHHHQSARCTSVADLFRRVEQTRGRRASVIISDGGETCNRSGLPRLSLPANGRVALVLVSSSLSVGSRPASVADSFRERREQLLRAAPWLQVVAPWEVGPDLFGPAEQRIGPASSEERRAERR
jgi:hypothetical protein